MPNVLPVPGVPCVRAAVRAGPAVAAAGAQRERSAGAARHAPSPREKNTNLLVGQPHFIRTPLLPLSGFSLNVDNVVVYGNGISYIAFAQAFISSS